MKRTIAIALFVTLLSGCQLPPPKAAPQVVTTLYFGLGLQDGSVLPETAWNEFVEKEIVPRFPDGFSIQPADGHWEHEGKPVHEPSRLLILVHPTSAAIDQKLEALRTIYSQKFQQDSVLRIDQPTERVSF